MVVAGFFIGVVIVGIERRSQRNLNFKLRIPVLKLLDIGRIILPVLIVMHKVRMV